MTWFTNKAKIKVTLSDYKGILNIQNSWKLIKILFLSMNEWSFYKMYVIAICVHFYFSIFLYPKCKFIHLYTIRCWAFWYSCSHRFYNYLAFNFFDLERIYVIPRMRRVQLIRYLPIIPKYFHWLRIKQR